MKTSNSLVLGREKRSTAGNRMMALLDQEFEQEEMFEEVEDDIDFIANEDEEDIYESDFQSTEEEGPDQNDSDAGEKQLEREIRQERKLARQKAQKAAGAGPLAPRTRPKPTSNTAAASGDAESSVAKKRRVSMGTAVNVETGEIIDVGTRHSKRSATVANKQELQSKLKDAMVKRASITKRAKVPVRSKTQDELIREALEMEEKNTASLREFLSQEEEKKNRAKVTQTQVARPLLRWISRAEEMKHPPVTVIEDKPLPSSRPPPAQGTPSYSTTSYYPYYPSYSYINNPSVGPSTQPDSQLTSAGTPQFPATTTALAPNLLATTSQSYSNYPYPYPPHVYDRAVQPPNTESVTTEPLGQPGEPTNSFAPQSAEQQNQAPTSSSAVLTKAHDDMPPVSNPTPGSAAEAVNESVKVTETPQEKPKHARNYVVLETNGPRTGWKQDMSYLFGRHVDWSRVEVVSIRNRPLTRRPPICPITGLQARYREPRSGIPYADSYAYQSIRGLLEHRYVWSDVMECYVADEWESSKATAVPAGWHDTIAGNGTWSEANRLKESGK